MVSRNKVRKMASLGSLNWEPWLDTLNIEELQRCVEIGAELIEQDEYNVYFLVSAIRSRLSAEGKANFILDTGHSAWNTICSEVNPEGTVAANEFWW